MIYRNEDGERGLFYNGIVDMLRDVLEVVVAHPGAGRETQTTTEEIVGYAVDVSGSVGVEGLAVHGFPKGTAFDTGFFESEAQGFYVGIWLAVGMWIRGGTSGAGGSAHGLGDSGGVCFVLVNDFEVGGEGDGAKPEVGIMLGRGVLVEGDTGDVGQELSILVLYTAMVSDVVGQDFHLSAAYAGADIAHSVVVAEFGMMVVRICFAGLSGEEHGAATSLVVGADECTATGGGNHLVAVE